MKCCDKCLEIAPQKFYGCETPCHDYHAERVAIADYRFKMVAADSITKLKEREDESLL